ncbi:putative MFS-type transporter protein [Lachnellula hyalina]|uniref:Putative MFS-type transporter protein n=1 Tax=Lachnellula hyalina TaxID=1316788 RepID=A0A8H8R1T6_9HELO|nr:putative MFS-type transporter protein [Lachnellula hyalina]TVY26957.1 putative MFS-type transporter protein [Lachnellula hyalina]
MATNTIPSPPIGLKWRSSTPYILFTISMAMFTDLFLYGIIVPTIPFILRDRLGIPHQQIQSLTSSLLSSYALASVLSSLPAGIIADKVAARQIPFLGGLLSLLSATALLFLGQSVPILLLARILQGISGAVVWTVGLALIRDTVGSANLGVTIGNIFAFISVGELISPVIGGVLYDKAGNAAVFGLCFALLGVDFIMRLVMIEKKTALKYELDSRISSETNSVIDDEESAAGETSPLLQTVKSREEEEEEATWIVPKDQPTLIQKFPIIYTLRNSRLLVAEFVALMQALVIGVFDSTIPTETEGLFGFSSLKSGLMFIPLVLPYLVFGAIAGKGVDKYGARIVATVGFGWMVLPLVLLRIPQPGGTAEIVKFCVLLAFSGLGFALISAPSLVEASYVLERYHHANKELFGEDGPYAQLYAINSMVFSAGLTLGPLIAGFLREKIGYGNMNAVVAGLCAVVSVLSWVFLGKIVKK